LRSNKVDFGIPANDDKQNRSHHYSIYHSCNCRRISRTPAAKDEKQMIHLLDENQKKAARLEAEAQAEAAGGGKTRRWSTKTSNAKQPKENKQQVKPPVPRRGNLG
jgi:hypothetical protein